jgi:hypothetical protein
MGPPSFGPLSGCRLLYKAPFPLGPAYLGICLLSTSDPFVEEGLARCGWWRPSVAGVMLVSGLCRSCRGHAAFDKVSVGGFSSSLPARSSDDEDASRMLA